MRRALQIAHLAVLCLLCALLAVLSLFLWEARQAARTSQQVIAQTGTDLHNTLENTNRVVLVIGGTMGNIRHATGEWEKSSQQQAAYFTQAAAKTTADLDTLDTVLTHLDLAITAQDRSLTATQSQAQATLAQFQTSLADLAPALKAATESLQNLARDTGDPNITKTIANLEAISANGVALSASAAHSGQMIEGRVQQMTRPASWAKSVGMTILDVGAKARTMFFGLF